MNLASNWLEATATIALAGHAWIHLQVLDLSVNFLDTDAIRHLSTLLLPNLATLRLAKSRRHMLDEEAAAILRRGQWPDLNHLDLWGSDFNAAAVAHVVSATWLQLKSLNLSECKLRADAIQQLAKGQWPLLETLRLAHNYIDVHFVLNLSRAAWPQLSLLCLSGKPSCERCMRELVSLHLPVLKHLHLLDSVLQLPAVDQLWKGSWPLLQTLFISMCVHVQKVHMVEFCQNAAPGFDFAGLTLTQAFTSRHGQI